MTAAALDGPFLGIVGICLMFAALIVWTAVERWRGGGR